MKIKYLKTRYMTLLELLIGMFLTTILLSILTYFYQDVTQLSAQAEVVQTEIFHTQYVENRLANVIPKALPFKKNTPFYFFTSNALAGIGPGSESLIFMFETGVDLDSTRAVNSLGRLYVDKDNKLKLASWSNPDDWDDHPPRAHIETLMENVKKLNFQFFVAPEKDRSLVPGTKKTAPPPVQPNGANAANSGTPKKPEIKKPTPPADGANPEGNPPASAEAVEPTPMAQVDPEPKGQWIKEWKKEYQQLPPLIKIEIVQTVDGKDVPITFAFPLMKSTQVIVYE